MNLLPPQNGNLSNLIIERTSTSPYINFNVSTGIFKIEGKSIQIYPGIFYSPFFSWILEYSYSSNSNINFKIQLEYVNGASSKLILSLLNFAIKIANEIGIECIIDWYYKKDDMFILELGENYMYCLKGPINLVERND
jgi:hypothetical protein